jgi:citrate synthase
MTERFQTMGTADAASITVRGHDLCDELIGRIDFASMVHLELRGALPSPAEADALNAVLVTLTEHGLTPSALATRLTYAGAPESLQGAVAAGVLGVGDVFLGAMEECARLLATLDEPGEGDEPERIRALVERAHAAGRRIPGLGHPIHKPEDPRTARLFALAERLGIPGVHRRRVELLRAAAIDVYDRPLPINVDGACAALLNDLGYPWQIQRGIAIVARAAGLVGHAWDEAQRPVGGSIWRLADEAIDYRAP